MKPEDVELDEEVVEEKYYTVMARGMLRLRISESRLDNIYDKLDAMKKKKKTIKELELAGNKIVIAATNFNKGKAAAEEWEKTPILSKDIIDSFRVALFKKIKFDLVDKNQTKLVKPE